MQYRDSAKYDSYFSYTYYAPFTWFIGIASFVIDIGVKDLYKVGDFLCSVLDKFGR